MKRSQLLSLIRECYTEVLHEDTTAVNTAKDQEKQKKEQWLQAKKSADDAELNDLRTNATINETDLEEMARIPTLYSLSPDINPEELTGTIKQIAQYLKENPGKTKMEIAKGIGKNAQQAVNMIVKAMEEKGILDSQGLAAEPKYKKSDGLGTGLRGRKLSTAGAKKKAIQSVYDKLMNGKEDEITFEEDDLIGDEDMKKIRDLVSQGGIKRGRKPKEPSEETGVEEEPAMYDQNDDDLFDEQPIDEPKESDDLEYTPEEEPVISSTEEDPEDNELTSLINKKDELLGQLKNKEIDLTKYKELIGDIPKRIKALQSGEEEEEVEDNNLRERMQRLANIKVK